MITGSGRGGGRSHLRRLSSLQIHRRQVAQLHMLRLFLETLHRNYGIRCVLATRLSAVRCLTQPCNGDPTYVNVQRGSALEWLSQAVRALATPGRCPTPPEDRPPPGPRPASLRRRAPTGGGGGSPGGGTRRAGRCLTLRKVTVISLVISRNDISEGPRKSYWPWM